MLVVAMLIILRLVHGLPEYKIVSVARQTGYIFGNTDAQSRGGGVGIAS